MFKYSRLVVGVLLFSVLATPAQITRSVADRSPAANVPESATVFAVGQRLTYEVSWADFVVAGELTVETTERRDFNGIEAYHATARARSIGLVSAVVYKVDDVYESFIDASSLLPFRASKNTRHGKKRQQSSATFDHDKRTATIEGGRSVEIPSNTYDITSLFYAVRMMDLTPGKVRTFTLIEDGKLYEIRVEPEVREKIRTRTGNHDVIRISTKAVRAGSARDPYQLRFYITNDSRRIPVLMTAEPSWGSVRMELTSFPNSERPRM